MGVPLPCIGLRRFVLVKEGDRRGGSIVMNSVGYEERRKSTSSPRSASTITVVEQGMSVLLLAWS